MAAPAVAGIAGLIRSYYPKLTASQVKKIIMESGIAPPIELTVGDKQKSLSDLCKSGKIVNLYNALIVAAKVSSGQISF